MALRLLPLVFYPCLKTSAAAGQPHGRPFSRAFTTGPGDSSRKPRYGLVQRLGLRAHKNKCSARESDGRLSTTWRSMFDSTGLCPALLRSHSTHSHCGSLASLWSRKFVARLAGGQAFRSRAPAFKFQCVWESLQSCQPDGLCNFGCAKP